MKSSDREEVATDVLKQEIQDLLSEAEATKADNINDSIKLLYKTANKLQHMKKDNEKMSVKNATQNKEELEIIYLSKFGNILYEIEEYEEALDKYNKIQKKIPGNCKVYKAQGDCYRKLEKYEEALEKYEEALDKYENDDSSSKSDKAAILNSKGLVELSMCADPLDVKHLNNALDIFKEAVELCPNNPLYHCNYGKVLYSLYDNKDDAIESFKKAHELIKDNKFGDELNNDNKEYIESTLGEFITQIEDLSNVQLNKQDKVIEKREAMFIEDAIESLHKTMPELNSEKILDTKQKLQIVQNNQPVYEYYDGFIFNVNWLYSTSVSVINDTFKINTSNTAVDGIALLVSFIPHVGSAVSTGVTKISDFIIESDVKRKANNVCKFASGVTQFEALAQDALLDSIIPREEELAKIDPENYILKAWSDKFKNLATKTKGKIEDFLYGNRNETPMQKLGYKDSCKLVKKIASGKIYQDELAIKIPYDEKLLRLTQEASKIINKEITDWPKKYIPKPEVPVVDKDKSGCCQIFTVYNKYDNELLNHPELIKVALQKLSLSKILDLSTELDKDLITEAVNDDNYDLVLAGLISLDTSI